MAIEQLFNQNNILIYFVGIFFICINKDWDDGKKLLIVYLITYCAKIFNILDLKPMLISFFAITFLYLEFLSNDEVKNEILNNIIYKILDYIYQLIFVYSGLFFLASLFFTSNIMCNWFQSILPINTLSKFILYPFSLLCLFLSFYLISCKEYTIESFTNIKKKMTDKIEWNKMIINDPIYSKYQMVTDIEDKSFFVRENSYNFLSIEYLKYVYNHRETIINKFSNLKHISKLKSLKIIIKRFNTFFKRGHSTIEMQLIRKLGLKTGYNHTFCRKIFELLYSKIFFKSLRKYYNKIKLDSKGGYRLYLMNIYILTADPLLANSLYDNMLAPWNLKSIQDISKEELFISTLGLPHRNVTFQTISIYSNIIDKYHLNKKKINMLLQSKLNELY